MTLCWSLDKLGPMARSVEDTMLVLNAISGPDRGDLASVPSKLDFDAMRDVSGLACGLLPALDEGGAGDGCGPACAGGSEASWAWMPVEVAHSGLAL